MKNIKETIRFCFRLLSVYMGLKTIDRLLRQCVQLVLQFAKSRK